MHIVVKSLISFINVNVKRYSLLVFFAVIDIREILRCTLEILWFLSHSMCVCICIYTHTHDNSRSSRSTNYRFCSNTDTSDLACASAYLAVRPRFVSAMCTPHELTLIVIRNSDGLPIIFRNKWCHVFFVSFSLTSYGTSNLLLVRWSTWR